MTEGHECPAAGGEQIFLYDLKAATTRQLTTAVSGKSTPRISGKRIIWADGRNGADFDVWSFDLSTNLEDILAGGAAPSFPGTFPATVPSTTRPTPAAAMTRYGCSPTPPRLGTNQ